MNKNKLLLEFIETLEDKLVLYRKNIKELEIEECIDKIEDICNDYVTKLNFKYKEV